MKTYIRIALLIICVTWLAIWIDESGWHMPAIGAGQNTVAAKRTQVAHRPSYTSPNHDATMACVMAKKMLTPKLKAPKSAEFDYSDCSDSAVHSGNTWTLDSYVDADNSFGAHIRNRYIVEMTNVPPSDRWHMEIVYFGE